MNNNKTAKILLGIFLVLSFGREGYRGFKETGDYWFFAIVTLIAIVACGFLIRSAFAPVTAIKIENKYSTYTWNFFKLLSIIGIIGFVFDLNRIEPPKYVIEIKGIKIPLDKCIQGSRNMITELEARKMFCTCLAGKLTGSDSVFNANRSLLEKGEIDKIMNDLKENNQIEGLGIENCFGGTDLQWTETIKNSLKTEMKSGLSGTAWEATHNVETFCNCMIEHFEKQPASKVLSGEYNKTQEFLTVDSICKLKSIVNRVQ